MSRMLWVAGLVLVGILVCAWAAVQRPAKVGQPVAVRTVSGAVPVSVAVKRQSPEVESIIGKLEEKAKAAVGVWQTVSGPEGKEGEAWKTGIAASGEWYWASEAKEPSTTAGYVLFDDGVDAFVLSRGAEGARNAYRFGQDTFRAGFTAGSGNSAQNYLIGYYLLHMNWMPRAFIGSMGGLAVVGEEKLDGVNVIHLRADAGKDERAIDSDLNNVLFHHSSSDESRKDWRRF